MLVQPSLCRTPSETTLLVFPRGGSNIFRFSAYGDIPPAQFEEVVLSLVKIQDDELWGERLAEKKRDALKESSEKAKAEAERLKKIGKAKEENLNK